MREEKERQYLQELEAADPMDPEVQRKLEEFYRQKRVDENMQIAYDEQPESFSDVIMLYVNLEVWCPFYCLCNMFWE